MESIKQIFIPIIAVAAFIIVVGLYTKNPSIFPIKSPTPTPDTRVSLKVGNTQVFIELADTPDKRRVGLSEKKSLGENDGMLFSFPQKDVFPSFWMKDMDIAIDIIWINDGEIVKIDKDAKPEPGVPDDKLKLYSPQKPIDFVLEVNAGFSDSHGFDIGTPVEGLP